MSLRVVQFGRLSLRQFGQVVGAEPTPFGKAIERLEFQPKSHHIGVRDESDTLIAVGGCDLVSVEFEGRGPAEMVGYGALIVRSDHRGTGVGRIVMDRLEEFADTLGPSQAVLLCDQDLVDVYAHRHFQVVQGPVWVDQDSGPVLYPGVMMWKSLDGTATLPTGTVRVHGLPF